MSRFIANGMIRMIGKPNASATTDHAMLLLPLQLTRVTFSATEESKYHPVIKDGDGRPFSQVHGNTSQWRATDLAPPNPVLQGWQDPICFTTTSTMTALPGIELPGDWPNGLNVKIRGTGIDEGEGYDFPATAATYSATTHLITTQVPIVCAQEFQGSRGVDYINPLTISWEISIDGGATWTPMASSSNECFVTLNDPRGPKGDAQYKLYQTVLYYACSNFGATSPDDAVTNSWALFAGPADIKSWNPTTKTYDRALRDYSKSFAASPQPVSLTAILQEIDGFGECYCFGQLFQDALWANGITTQTGVLVVPTTGDSRMLINNWGYSATGSIANEDPIYAWELAINTYPTMDMQPPPYPSDPNNYGDITNEPGLAGQNAPTPLEKVFGNHYIVKYEGSTTAYYDPSYGRSYSDAIEFENNAVAGYAKAHDSVSLKVRPSSGLHNITFMEGNRPHQ